MSTALEREVQARRLEMRALSDEAVGDALEFFEQLTAKATLEVLPQVADGLATAARDLGRLYGSRALVEGWEFTKLRTGLQSDEMPDARQPFASLVDVAEKRAMAGATHSMTMATAQAETMRVFGADEQMVREQLQRDLREGKQSFSTMRTDFRSGVQQCVVGCQQLGQALAMTQLEQQGG